MYVERHIRVYIHRAQNVEISIILFIINTGTVKYITAVILNNTLVTILSFVQHRNHRVCGCCNIYMRIV